MEADSLNKSEYEGIQAKLAESLESKRWQILNASTFESQGDAVTTLTIDALVPPPNSVLFNLHPWMIAKDENKGEQ